MAKQISNNISQNTGASVSTNKSQVILSGIKPTNKIHIGNLFGSVFQWVDLLKNNPQNKAVFIIVDQHAITVDYDVQTFAEQTFSIAATYFAAGINFDKNIVFIQSHNPDHTFLSWMLTCLTPMGWLERMTQYKDLKQKLSSNNKSIGTGILMYPVLMAADILLYDTDVVPVGEDQVQHVELTRDIAKRFNAKYGQTFKIPTYYINKVVARVKDLIKPHKKMSKSDETGKGVIFITDTPDIIKQKIMRATTDNVGHINYDKEKQPGIANLLEIFSYVTKKDIKKLVQEYESINYAKFKADLADALIEFLKPFQDKYYMFMNDKEMLSNILHDGLERARQISSVKINKVRDVMGFVAPLKQ